MIRRASGGRCDPPGRVSSGSAGRSESAESWGWNASRGQSHKSPAGTTGALPPPVRMEEHISVSVLAKADSVFMSNERDQVFMAAIPQTPAFKLLSGL